MKKISILIICLIACSFGALSQELYTIKGRVEDSKSQPIPFATVVILKDGVQVVGTTTEESGSFSLNTTEGSNLTLVVKYVGYDPLNIELNPMELCDIGALQLQESSTEIEAVEVTAHLIRREADRFVVDVANSPAAVGKDGSELLKSAPGVWVEEDGLSINGNSGTKVYINDREVKLEKEQLIIYLRSLRAEDISKIEVIPQSGADYDANSSSGIIKITLKRRRENGLMGSTSYTLETGEYGTQHNAHISLDYSLKRLNIYSSGWYYGGGQSAKSEELTQYFMRDMSVLAKSHLQEDINNGGAKLGAIYEVNSRHSFGGEFEFWQSRNDDLTPSTTEISEGETTSYNRSIYDPMLNQSNFMVTLNYIYKLDTLGSTLKILTDYTKRNQKSHSDNSTQKYNAESVIDSLYQERTKSQYDVFTTTLAIEKRLSALWQLRTGAKYTLNNTSNEATYRYLNNGVWSPSNVDDYSINYTENIAALYLIATGRIGRFSLTAGLRGEYTNTSGKGDTPKQSYFSLFPNANLAYNIDKMGKHSIIASYSRSIRRPGFWELTPSRITISDYTYQMGNPELEPAFNNQYSLTLVAWYRYTLTAIVRHSTNDIQQILTTDPTDRNKLLLTSQNFPDNTAYILSLSAPAQINKWWQWNSNFSYIHLSQRLTPDSAPQYSNVAQWYTAMTFNLPAKFILELSYNGQSRAKVSNIEIGATHSLGFSLKKRLLNERLTISVSGGDLLDIPTKVTTNQADFSREMRIKQSWGGRSFSFGISWNFHTGKTFRSRTIESGSAEERARM